MSNDRSEQAVNEVRQYISSGNRLQRLRSAMRRGMACESFLRMMLTTLDDNFALANCTPQSIYKGAMEAADLGITIGGPYSEGCLVPYNNEAVFQLEYRGLKKLAKRHPDVMDVEFGAIHKGDKFTLRSTRSEIEITRSGSRTRRFDPVTHAYATVWLTGGLVKTDVWTVQECIAHRDRRSSNWKRYQAKYGNPKDKKNYNLDKMRECPWHEESPDFPVMCGKTVLRAMVARGDIPLELLAQDVLQREDSDIIDGSVVGARQIEQQSTLQQSTAEPSAETQTTEMPEPEETSAVKFTGVMCPNLDEALQKCNTLAAVGVIRDFAIEQADLEDEEAWIRDACNQREAEIRASRTARANRKEEESSGTQQTQR